MHALDYLRRSIRSQVRSVARGLNRLSGGRLTPNRITTIGVAMHVPIAFVIAYGYLTLGGILLLVFGLFDVLDGELARVQGRSSIYGMFYDATTDRIKEVLIYSAIIYYLAGTTSSHWAYVAIIACGTILTVSYAKAKGEVGLAVKQKITDPYTLNRHFNEGLVSYEVRTALIIVGLVFHVIVPAIAAVAILGVISIFIVMNTIRKEL
jgi:phosphatidylserine synthase